MMLRIDDDDDENPTYNFDHDLDKNTFQPEPAGGSGNAIFGSIASLAAALLLAIAL